jgi:hypothetical protein
MRRRRRQTQQSPIETLVLETMGRESFGTLVYDEIVFPIATIILERGQLTFHAVAMRDVDLGPEGEIRVHGTDGSLIAVTRTRIGAGARGVSARGSVIAFPVRLVDPDWPAAPELPDPGRALPEGQSEREGGQ